MRYLFVKCSCHVILSTHVFDITYVSPAHCTVRTLQMFGGAQNSSQQRNPRVIQQSLNNLACEVKAGPGSTGSVSSRATPLLPGTALVIRGGHKNFAGQKLGIKRCVLQDSCKKQYIFLSILLVVS